MARTTLEVSVLIADIFKKGQLHIGGKPVAVQGLLNRPVPDLASRQFFEVLDFATTARPPADRDPLYLVKTVANWMRLQIDSKGRTSKDVLLEIVTTLRQCGFRFERIPEIEAASEVAATIKTAPVATISAPPTTPAPAKVAAPAARTLTAPIVPPYARPPAPPKNPSPPPAPPIPPPPGKQTAEPAAMLSASHDYLALIWGDTTWYVLKNGAFLPRDTKIGSGPLDCFKNAGDLLANHGQRMADGITLEEKNEVIAARQKAQGEQNRAKDRKKNEVKKRHRAPVGMPNH